MKLSYNWLKEYINPIPEPEHLSEILTNLGLEVESYEAFTTIPGNLEGLVVGYTLQVVQHPNADRLKICSVDIGKGIILSIICGAPNVAAYQKVIVAPVGTLVFPLSAEPFQIGKSKIRGEYSEGMLCADDEIGLGKSHEGIRILPSDWEIGTPLRDYIKPYQDFSFEIGITPNRSDALSHRGAARDVLAFLNQTSISKEWEDVSYTLPISNAEKSIEIEINDPENCFRFSGITLSGIQVKESPDWLKNRLAAIGIRAINNIVDITNFVMQDMGQPLHAYDRDSLKGGKIQARKAIKEEKIITLDGITRVLTDKDLVIADQDLPLSIAGVFGGRDSGITKNTQTVFLESACFNPVSVRKTARRLSLKTDASFRFERGTDPDFTLEALYRATQLIINLAGGTLDSKFLDIYPKTLVKPIIVLRKSRLSAIIGQIIDPNRVEQILEGLGIKILEKNMDSWNLEIPLFKADVYREIDIIEEVLRVYGLNQIQIPQQIRASIQPSLKPDPEKIQEEIANFLSARGFHEILSNSLVNSTLSELFSTEENAEPVLVLHPLSIDTNMLRTSIIPSLLRSVEYNLNRKLNDLSLYEFGRIYFKTKEKYAEKSRLGICWTGKNEPENWKAGQNGQIKTDDLVDFFQVKGIVSSIFNKLGFEIDMKPFLKSEMYTDSMEVIFQGTRLAHFGNIKPSLLKSFRIEKETFYAELEWDKILNLKKVGSFISRDTPRFPGVQRDLSLILSQETHFDELQEIVHLAKIPILKEMSIFDVYQGKRIPEGKKSYSLRFFLQNENQTLTEKEIDSIMKKLMELFQKKVNAEIPVLA